MIEQNQFLTQPQQNSPILSQPTSNKKVNVYFTYQSSPQPVFEQNLRVIKQQQEEKKRRKIFQPRRKMSYQQLSVSKRRMSRLRIFQQGSKGMVTEGGDFIEKRKDCNKKMIMTENHHRSGIFTNQNNDKTLRRNNTAQNLFGVDSNNQPNSNKKNMKYNLYYQNSPINLKDSIISGVQTIVDQLEYIQPQQLQQTNPINRKLSLIRNRSNSKRTFNSKTNTVKNSLMLNSSNHLSNIIIKSNNVKSNNGQSQQYKRNRIQSEVINYQYLPLNNKYRSSVTIKATSKPYYGMSKFSNRLSILTNDNHNHNSNNNQYNNNDDDNLLIQDFHHDNNQDIQTPKYHKSAYRSVMRKSYQPSSMVVTKNNKIINDNTSNKQNRSKSSQRKNNLIEVNSHPQTDRFYDQSSIQTPRLPVVMKKISYQVIDPLTSSLKKQKLERKQLRKISQVTQVKNNNQNNSSKIKAFFFMIIALITQFVSKTTNTAQKGKQGCFKFLTSQLFFLAIIVMLSLAIFAIQLVQ